VAVSINLNGHMACRNLNGRWRKEQLELPLGVGDRSIADMDFL
jgi:hypothetical protein